MMSIMISITIKIAETMAHTLDFGTQSSIQILSLGNTRTNNENYKPKRSNYDYLMNFSLHMYDVLLVGKNLYNIRLVAVHECKLHPTSYIFTDKLLWRL